MEAKNPLLIIRPKRVAPKTGEWNLE